MSLLDWKSFMQTYNTMHKKNYTQVTDWISDLYNKHDKYASPLARELGISTTTIMKYLKKWGLYEKKSRGGIRLYDGVGKKEKIFLSIPKEIMCELTKDQIMERCGIQKNWCNVLLRRHKRKFRKEEKF